MLKAFKQHIEKSFPELLNNHFIIACSGGLDSVVLSTLCQQAGLQFSIAHCNFRLRGVESDGDELFVQEFAKNLNKTIYLTHFDTLGYVNQHKVSVQMGARELRYTWFEQLLKENSIAYLLTAHHANDNLETFIINLSRGTGIEGLTGIPSKINYLRRPLLPFTRQELEDFAQSLDLNWREDASNADTKYLRNKIRLEIVPNLNELHSTFFDNFKNTIAYLSQTEQIASAYLQKLKKDIFIEKEGRITISIQNLKELKPLNTYLHGLFGAYGFKELDNLEALLTGMSGKQLLSATHILVKNRDSLVLSELIKNDENDSSFLITEEMVTIEFPLPLKFSTVTERSDNTEKVIFVQKNTLKYPLEIRKWKNGDYFYPIGLNRKKKLSKFFKDEKVDVLAKEEKWLLCSNEQIVWVVGMRADHRFRVVDTEHEILKIEFK
ncbi:tRNA lysidine(34) synthetase TilS [Maribacter hydrothermalis]|uniref:tRNA(Ile)-lysidine synthase n=1 Tax=Maribacter hydrothermalis TaxID=1836467 RepID=A0A1B7Z6M4_9FLAO|nr:tRNA lysidine(34) synthetase TilS [Maribacter hydrothermalis]APQ18656.1 tRNA lysidine(34) synthetase TilS [Maribacter hydrothermalis]OBR38351.1 tRNA lysidine(34) synthetase TilS [Maribacter hydrothermalis]